MKVLLTGANGQLGQCVQDVFRDLPHELIALDRHSLNIANQDQVMRVINHYRPDYIINAAAYTAVDKAESEPELAAQINSQGPANLADAATSVDAVLIHISTDYVFDGSKTTPYTENDPTHPLGVYGHTKLKGEQAVQARCERHIILRTAWVFSEYGNNFMKTMLRLGNERDQLSVVDDQRGCPTYAGDIASACLQMIEQIEAGKAHYGVYHFGGDEPVSWCGFARAIFEAAEKNKVLNQAPAVTPISTEQYPTPAKRPAYSVLSVEKLGADYGVEASNWRAAIKQVFPQIKGQG